MIDLPPGTREKVYGPAYVSERLDIEGHVAAPRSFALAELLPRPRTERRIAGILCGSGKVKTGPQLLSGILLRDLVDEVSIPFPEHELPNRTWLRATGRDGYSASFSWHEVWNGPVGEGLIVALERDGQPLDDREGRLCLVSTADYRPGPRRVRYLCRVEVLRL